MKNMLLNMVQLLKQGESFVLASICASSGSTPRAVGARMLVRADGTIMGTIGGGLLEARVQQLAPEVLLDKKALAKTFLLTGEDPEMDMICGGQTEVLLEFIDATDDTYLMIYGEALAAMEACQRAWLLAAIPAAGQNDCITRQCLVKEDGAVVGAVELSSAIGIGAGSPIGLFGDESDGVKELLDLCSSRHPAVITQGARRLLVEPLCQESTVYIFGAGHISRELAPFCEKVGFRTVVLDDRREFANRDRFDSADEIGLIESFEHALRGLAIDQDSYLVIVTRGHVHDQTVLAQALRTNAAYIGMIGSKQKRDATYQALAEEGFTAHDFARVHSPIGLAIGAESPEEIAVSIVAELIKVRAEQR